MSGTEMALLSALVIIVVGGLFYTKRLGNVFFKNKDMEMGLEAPKTAATKPVLTPATNIQVNINEEGFKKELENLKRDFQAQIDELKQNPEGFQKSLSSGILIQWQVNQPLSIFKLNRGQV